MALSDIAIIVLVAAVAIFGFVKGAKKSTASFFKFAVSIVAAFALTKTVAMYLLNLDFVARYAIGYNSLPFFFRSLLPSGLDKISTASIRAQCEGQSTIDAITNVNKLFVDSKVDSFFMKYCFSMFSNALINPTYLQSAMPSAVDIIALEMTYSLFCVIVCLLLFGAFRMLVALFSMLFKPKKPTKKKFSSRMGGFFIGGIKGFTYSVLIMCVITMMGCFSFMSMLNNDIGKSKITRVFASASTFIVSNTIQSDQEDPRFARLIEIARY